MDTESVFGTLAKIQSWPDVGLVFAICIIAGYCWKLAKWKFFPNDAIPPVVILTGAVAMLLLSGAEPANVTGRVWHTRLFIIGAVIGFGAWLSHALILTRLEDWLSGIFPSVNTLLNSKPTPPPPSVLSALALACGLMALTGCAALAPGADPFVVRVEQAQSIASPGFDFVLHVDNADRGFWRTNAPAFHSYCEWLRTPTPYGQAKVPRVVALQFNVDDLKLAYKGARSESNSNALYMAWMTLSTALGQANSWSNIVSLPIH